MTFEERDELQEQINAYVEAKHLGGRSARYADIASIALVSRISQALPPTEIFDDATFYIMASGLFATFFRGASFRFPVPVVDGWKNSKDDPKSYVLHVPVDLLRRATEVRGLPLVHRVAKEVEGE